LYGGNANRKDANDGLDRAGKDFRVHAWFGCAKDIIFLQFELTLRERTKWRMIEDIQKNMQGQRDILLAVLGFRILALTVVDDAAKHSRW
jgi:hypothetical protein